ncbi:hypothetical protein [Roseivivax jejudonensis]|uniref:hypothetical protein n=1 Tax=Roseivivax jejudonensis TaxID=1529041 RepID=UPI0013563191|nr:hypothetical protein [Roseivivax jejudonensis]
MSAILAEDARGCSEPQAAKCMGTGSTKMLKMMLRRAEFLQQRTGGPSWKD